MHPQIVIDKPAADEGARIALADEPVQKSRAQRYRNNETVSSYFEADGKLHIVRKQDVTDVLEACKARHNQGVHGHKETRHLAMIPESVVEKYCETRQVSLREFIRDKNHMKAILNDPDLRNFRIYPGRV
jgi:hypothetical protein